ncbi:hypothetical protein GE21DRAFT_2436 [Neurospora crassa]|uniref:Uncharacterized protein n=1 Tax=Neurospora crassa (strain ATCC 24698 / 74-OR23-1A / CBS 708.71 / DSM 1257 / FGSC 987) TaxID=367110 RepID=Q7SDP9_NEUCR|nr:hypothetical protein NCU02857 [Neurospora crassa OR74A]EAA34911.2 hypothetical protein NCU02857 [Neurospora crassa OR74A]KHE81972.1 hypothetical protein GE21DRAFT_2436 [Neurospora crassa]|eukprot:XP_964147.2 hypothetical protein NCU02857 [Neurospora crassa OR74A]
MFSFLIGTVARLATPLIYKVVAPILRPTISHAVGYFQPIEAGFDYDHGDNPLVVGIDKVIDNVDIVRKQIKAVCKAPIVVTSRVVDKAVVVVVKKLRSVREEPVAAASQIVKGVAGIVEHFVRSFLLRRTNDSEIRPWIKPKQPRSGRKRYSIDQTRTSSFVKCISSAYPTPPPSCSDGDDSPARRDKTSPVFDATSQEADTTTVVNFHPRAYSPDVDTPPRSESTVSSLDLGESIDSLTSLTSVTSVETHLPSEISFPSSRCSSDLSEIRLPLYSPSHEGVGSKKATSEAEKFSDDKEDTVNRARAIIAFRLDHEETDRLDSSLEQGSKVDGDAQVGSEKREVEGWKEEPSEIEAQGELVSEADVAGDSETAIELQNSEDPVLTLTEPNRSQFQELNPASNLQAISNAALEPANTQSPVAVNTSMPPEQPQELAASSIDDDTETIYPDDDDLEPYVFNWEDHVFIDATGHLDTYQRVHDANFNPSRQYLQHCHWVGLFEAYKPKQIITHYLGPVDASSQHQPILPVPELTVTTPEGYTLWLDDPLPWNRLCMNRRWLRLNFIDDYGYLDTWKRVTDEEKREQVMRGYRRLQRDNWVLSKFAPLEKRLEGLPEIVVTVPEGGTFYLNEPRSWADLDDDDDDW